MDLEDVNKCLSWLTGNGRKINIEVSTLLKFLAGRENKKIKNPPHESTVCPWTRKKSKTVWFYLAIALYFKHNQS